MELAIYLVVSLILMGGLAFLRFVKRRKAKTAPRPCDLRRAARREAAAARKRIRAAGGEAPRPCPPEDPAALREEAQRLEELAERAKRLGVRYRKIASMARRLRRRADAYERRALRRLAHGLSP
ncbi:MAG: hypothetical protein KatS3mg087_1345 [Patescibacteria group bacterium]|nr:MAG: hypothetical protein KatS3mg087_1345 [Patescibacteria group bacterium]